MERLNILNLKPLYHKIKRMDIILAMKIQQIVFITRSLTRYINAKPKFKNPSGPE